MVVGPITLEAKVHFTKPGTNVIGSATVGLGVGEPVTLEALHRAVGQTLAALPEGCRLLDPYEFFNKVLVKEKTGRAGNFATPASFHYDADALAEAGRAAYTPEPKTDDDEGDDENWDDDDLEDED